MRTLYIVTHPEATHHVEGRVGGWYDSELTPTGLGHAEAVARRLAERIPQGAGVRLYTSDLRRTAQTAEAIGRRLGVAAIEDARLREKSYGVAEGRPQSWLDERFVAPPPHGERLGHDEGIDGAETMAHFGARVYAAMDDILASPSEHQIVSTHGGALTFVAAAFLRLPLEGLQYFRLRAQPGGITVLQEDDHFHNRSLRELSDTTHLSPLSPLSAPERP